MVRRPKSEQAGLGADRGELGVVDENLVGRELIGPGFNVREPGIEAGGGVVVRVAGSFLRGVVLLTHGSILSGWGIRRLRLLKD